jgi:hypothetical protein
MSLQAQQLEPERFLLEKEAALGAALAADIRAHTVPVPSHAVQEYVQGVGQRVSGQIMGSFPWKFSVVTGHSSQKPLALPGGYLFMPAEALLDARDEDELAGMMARAMARLPVPVQQLASIPLVFVGGWLPQVYLPLPRQMEAAADVEAIRILRAVGYRQDQLGVPGPDEAFLTMRKQVHELMPLFTVRAVPSLFASGDAHDR